MGAGAVVHVVALNTVLIPFRKAVISMIPKKRS